MRGQKLITILEIAIKASLEAGKEILKIYEEGFDVEYKDDKSPLTIADKKSNEVINTYLVKTDIPLLSEEDKSIPFKVRKEWEKFWMIDPLDGTKEFIKRNGEFTVNIALISNNKPMLGVIYVPVQKVLYFGCEETGSYKVENIKDIELNNSIRFFTERGKRLPVHAKNNIFTVVGSKSHMTVETEDYINVLRAKYDNVNILSRGSSLKICMVAEGIANEYPRFAPTMEWDIAAGHAIVKYANKNILNSKTNREMSYNKDSLVNPWFIVK